MFCTILKFINEKIAFLAFIFFLSIPFALSSDSDLDDDDDDKPSPPVTSTTSKTNDDDDDEDDTKKSTPADASSDNNSDDDNDDEGNDDGEADKADDSKDTTAPNSSNPNPTGIPPVSATVIAPSSNSTDSDSIGKNLSNELEKIEQKLKSDAQNGASTPQAALALESQIGKNIWRDSGKY